MKDPQPMAMTTRQEVFMTTLMGVVMALLKGVFVAAVAILDPRLGKGRAGQGRLDVNLPV